MKVFLIKPQFRHLLWVCNAFFKFLNPELKGNLVKGPILKASTDTLNVKFEGIGAFFVARHYRAINSFKVHNKSALDYPCLLIFDVVAELGIRKLECSLLPSVDHEWITFLLQEAPDLIPQMLGNPFSLLWFVKLLNAGVALGHIGSCQESCHVISWCRGHISNQLFRWVLCAFHLLIYTKL